MMEDSQLKSSDKFSHIQNKQLKTHFQKNSHQHLHFLGVIFPVVCGD